MAKNKILEEIENKPEYKSALESVSKDEQKKIKSILNGFTEKLINEIIDPLEKVAKNTDNIEEIRKEIARLLSGAKYKAGNT